MQEIGRDPRDPKHGTSILCPHDCPTDPRFFAAAYDDGASRPPTREGAVGSQ